MLYIITDRKFNEQNKAWVQDVEALFNVRKSDIINRYESNTLALEALKTIEGMTEHRGDMIIAKFGAVALQDISTGGKVCLISALYDDIVISTDEAGYNCINLLCEMSKVKDIFIYSSCSYTHILGVETSINGISCNQSDEILDIMEEFYD